MELKEQCKDLTERIKNTLPLKALPTRELVQIFRKRVAPVILTLKSEIIITDIHNSGDISGIMCVIQNEEENIFACALTHLTFSPTSPLYNEIFDYQRKREKRIKKLNKRGLN